MSQLLLLNPRRRRRKAKGSRRSRRARKMTAKQLKFFGPRRSRRARRRTLTIAMNPVRRLRSRRSRRSGRRSFRRNPISMPRMSASLSTVTRAATNAAVGAGGALAVDIAMAQAARFLPANMTARYDAQTGAINPLYYVAKGGLAVALGVVGGMVLPGRMKSLAARAAEGALTVQAYEISRSFVPASMLGYYSPGTIAGLRGGRMGRMGYLLNRPGGMAGSPAFASVGGSARTIEGYSL